VIRVLTASGSTQTFYRCPTPSEKWRLDQFLRSRIVEYRDRCFACRLPVLIGDPFLDHPNTDGSAYARFHEPCFAKWRAEMETLGRKVLGIDSVNPRPTPCP
jgi:hypothetical protein